VSGAVKRSSRVSERLREELSTMLRGLDDPRVLGALVTRVEMPDDLQSAKVFVRRGLGAGDERERREAVSRVEELLQEIKKDGSGEPG